VKGFLFDENIPIHIEFSPVLPVEHVTDFKLSSTDTEIWEYAKRKDLVIVTKDADFSNRIIVTNPPPRVVHLRFGNVRKKDYHSFLKKIWPQIEMLIKDFKLVNVYLNSFECIE
jgi:predicted nuclease of predicted toxin-antitoxin system